MDQFLFQAHSGLRFLVLLAAIVAIALLAWGWSARRPYAGPVRASVAVFGGLLGIQLLVGIGLLLVRPFYGALTGHLVMMVAAVGVAHATAAYARRRSDGRQAHAVALSGVALALLLVIGGIMAIRSSPFHVTPRIPAPAAATE